MRGAGQRVLEVVESAYDLSQKDDEWLAGVGARVLAALGGELGLVACRFRLSRDGRVDVTSDVAVGPVPAGFLHAIHGASQSIPVRVLIDPMVGLATGSQLAAEGILPAYDPETWDAYAQSVRLGVRDHLGGTTVDACGAGIHFCIPKAQTSTVHSSDRARWRLVLAHVLAGLRLREHAQREEAVLAPGGRVLHAEGDARSRSALEALRVAAIGVDAARSRAGRHDVDHALSLWRALVRGRWSVIDRFDHDGRRFLVARRNDPRVDPAGGFSRREAQVAAFAALGYANKSIAYLLGVHPSTVSCHLRSAMRRVGARSVTELAELLRAVRPPGGEDA